MQNQRMTVTIGHNVFNIDHKTMMGNLNQFWDCGNAYRIEKGLPAKHLDNWMRSPELAEYVAVLEREFKSVESTDYKNEESDQILNTSIRRIIKDSRLTESISKKSSLFVTKRGKGGGTWAHLYILLDAATFLDPDFKYQVYKTFVEGKLLQHRDESGDRYRPFNMAIDQLPDRAGKDNKWLYVHAANALASRLGLPTKEKGVNRWNEADAHQLSARADAEKMLTSMVQFGVVRDWEHLKELIDKV
jgi:hypothetical protein